MNLFSWNTSTGDSSNSTWYVPYAFVDSGAAAVPSETTVYVPTKFERQRTRFRAQLGRRRGQYLALEVAEALKGGGV